MTARKFWAIIVAVLVLVVVFVLYYHFMPVWASIQVSLAYLGGMVFGWIAHILYCKYIK